VSRTQARHPIGVVSTRTGLPQDVIRAWERRYEAVTPTRSGTGRRLYSDEDLERFRLLKAVVDSGRRISDVAQLPRKELERLAAEDREAVGRVPPARRGGGRTDSRSAPALLSEAIAAVIDLDAPRLGEVLERASLAMSSFALRAELLVPLMREIGDRWREGELRVAHEHVASAAVRSFLGMSRSQAGGPVIVMGTPAGARHEFGALIAADCARDLGWDVVYAGADLPAEDLASTAVSRDAVAVALSIVYPGSSPAIREELLRLRRLVGSEKAIAVGGAAAAEYAATLREIGATTVADLESFQEFLARSARRPR